MGIVLAAWAAAYYFAQRLEQGRSREDEVDEEKAG
jgi:hypothetical protein